MIISFCVIFVINVICCKVDIRKFWLNNCPLAPPSPPDNKSWLRRCMKCVVYVYLKVDQNAFGNWAAPGPTKFESPIVKPPACHC